MNPLIFEAVMTGFKEGLKIGVVWLVFNSYLVRNRKKEFIKPFYAAISLVLLASVALFSLPVKPVTKEYLNNFINMSFALFLISSAAALYHAAGVNILKPFKDSGGRGLDQAKTGTEGPAIYAAVFVLTLLFFLPDIAGSVFFLKELSAIKETFLRTQASALAGTAAALSLLFIPSRYLRPSWLGSFFALPQLLLFMAIVKLLGGGIKGFSEISLIPAIQRGFMKFFHDFIHQTFVLIMVPDHPLLKTTVWNFIGFFFGSNIAVVASLLSLLFFPFLFIYHGLIKNTPDPRAETGAERRKIKAVLLTDRRRKALPVIIFVCLIIVSWFSGSGESVSRLYNPKPKPVIEDKGMVLIPVNDPTMDLKDGSLHKFSLAYKGREIRIIIIKKPDNDLAVCLDACEICPPDGYGQRDDMVVCIYCNTPMPIPTLGRAGGCNPIPLVSNADDRFVRIGIDEIMKKWAYVKTNVKEKAR